MKKLAILLTVVFITASGISQNNKVVSAYDYHRNGKLAKAKESIDPALTHPKSMNNAKTWYFCGNIYIDISRSTDTAIRNLDPDALDKAYNAYKKSMELDEKSRYKLEVLQRMPLVAEAYFNKGANKYNVGRDLLFVQKDTSNAIKVFTESMISFENAYKIYSESGKTDTTTMYYVALTAEFAQEYDKAKMNLQKLISFDYQQASLYSSMGKISTDFDTDTVKAAEYFALGRQKFPNDLSLLLNETNLFLATKETDKAMENLKIAAEIDEENPSIFFTIGFIYSDIVDDTSNSEQRRQDAFELARNAYDRAIELKPLYFEPNYNMGALYVNKASSLIAIANKLPFDEQEKYDKMKAEADSYLKKSLPFLEKALEIQPDSFDTLVSLKEIYTRLNMMEELKEVNSELSKMTE